MKNAKQLIERLFREKKGFTIYTDIMYGRGINGVDFRVFSEFEEFGGDLKTRVYRVFSPEDDYLVITEHYTPPEIPWNRAAEKKPYTLRKYVDYDRITFISETIEED